ncbi:hypothetical protein [Methylobacterium nigriterrae]|uniref:hypothetical protein n=1 Tax=Methylobacterium nigriterrae TaxID=3127512 RepID=UPI0030133909
MTTEPLFLILLVSFGLGCLLIHAARQFATALTPVLAGAAVMLAAAAAAIFAAQSGLSPPAAGFIDVPLAYQAF